MLRTIMLAAAAASLLAAQDHSLGYDDTPSYPGSKWRVHDSKRPRPEAITPGACNAEPSKPPSDAEVLFDGTGLDKWETKGGAPTWKVENGYVEIVPGKGDLVTTEKFGDIQLHLQWAAPSAVSGNSQGRGNSGVKLMTLHEVQVLDSYHNPTYADGQAAAVYGQHPPLVNASFYLSRTTRGPSGRLCASCKPGEWQTYDIAFDAPKFEGDKLVKPGYVTVFQNGVLVQDHAEIWGETLHRQVGKYSPHGDMPLLLQNHGNPDRYRNIWIRKIRQAE